MTTRALVSAILGLGILAGSTAIAHAQRTARGSAVGYEMEGAAIPAAPLEALPAQVQTALAACATEAMPYVGQPVRARLTVAPAGRVSAVAIEVERADAGAAACVERALSGLTFPARRAVTTLILDLAFAARGPDTSRPEHDPATAAYRASVVEAFERHQPAVHACFVRARSAHESPDHRVFVEFVIAADGRVTSPAVPLGDEFPQLAECLVSEMRTWTVPRPPHAPFPLNHRFSGEVVAFE